MIYPLFDSLRLGFFMQVTRGVEQFVGAENYVTLLTDEAILQPRMLNALKNSFLFFAVNMLVQNPIALLLAAGAVDENQRRFALPRADFLAGYPVSSDCRICLEALVKPAVGDRLRYIEGFRAWGLTRSPGWGLESTALITLALISAWQYLGIPMMLYFATLDQHPE